MDLFGPTGCSFPPSSFPLSPPPRVVEFAPLMSTTEVEPPERLFDPSRFPLEQPAHDLVVAFRALIEKAEKRQRARRSADQLRFEKATSALVLDLAHQRLKEPRGALYVSLGKDYYSSGSRPAPFLTEAFPDLLRQLASLGILELELGFQGAFGTGRRSTIRAGRQLKLLIDGSKIRFGDIGRIFELQGDPLVLRSEKVRGKAEDLPIPESEHVARLREEMGRVNDWLNGAHVQWCPVKEDEKDPDTGNRYMRRHFTRTLGECGRLNGGFWQGMKKKLRLSSILINDLETVELDYGQIGIRVAYAHCKATPPEGDLYDIPGLEGYRGSVKMLMNALLARTQKSNRFPRGMAHSFPPALVFRQVFDLVAQHHIGIAHLFGTGFYLVQQRVESTILLKCIHQMIDEGIHGLPNHDCLTVSIDDAARTKEIMEMKAYEVLGIPVPVDQSIDEGYDYLLASLTQSSAGRGEECSIVTGALYLPSSNTPTVSPSVPHKRGA